MPLIVSPRLAVPEIIEPLQRYGWTGVQLFFVISAFSLCLTMPRHEASPRPLLSYAISRLSRIAPLFYLLLLCNVFYVAARWGAYPDPYRVLTSLTFTYNLFPAYSNGIVGAGWTIGTEMLFYLLFPLVYANFRSIGARIALICLSIGFWHLFKANVIPLIEDDAVRRQFASLTLAAHFPSFALGMLAFSIYEQFKHHRSARHIGATLFCVGVLGIGLLLGNPYRFGVLEYNQWPSVFYTAMLVGLGLCPLTVIVNRVTEFYGVICYSLYLWHPPVIFALAPTYRWIYSQGFGVGASFSICLAVTIAVATGVAVLSYRFIELPGLSLGRKVKDRLLNTTRLTAERGISPTT